MGRGMTHLHLGHHGVKGGEEPPRADKVRLALVGLALGLLTGRGALPVLTEGPA